VKLITLATVLKNKIIISILSN